MIPKSLRETVHYDEHVYVVVNPINQDQTRYANHTNAMYARVSTTAQRSSEARSWKRLVYSRVSIVT